MAVERYIQDRSSQEGQSVLEFLLTLPLLVGITVLMIRVNTAIQISIVDQQYARQQTLFLAFNSPVYPVKRFIEKDFVANGTNRMVIGVAENTAPQDGSPYIPEAQTFRITRFPNQRGDEAEHKEPAQRSNVRVRNTVELCTQNNVIALNGQNLPLNGDTLKEKTKFTFCRSQFDQ